MASQLAAKLAQFKKDRAKMLADAAVEEERQRVAAHGAPMALNSVPVSASTSVKRKAADLLDSRRATKVPKLAVGAAPSKRTNRPLDGSQLAIVRERVITLLKGTRVRMLFDDLLDATHVFRTGRPPEKVIPAEYCSRANFFADIRAALEQASLDDAGVQAYAAAAQDDPVLERERSGFKLRRQLVGHSLFLEFLPRYRANGVADLGALMRAAEGQGFHEADLFESYRGAHNDLHALLAQKQIVRVMRTADPRRYVYFAFTADVAAIPTDDEVTAGWRQTLAAVTAASVEYQLAGANLKCLKSDQPPPSSAKAARASIK